MDKLKLNLGSGIVYRPEYVNIDRFGGSLADIVCDVGDLPFDSQSVGSIDALQLIEHFDYVHCVYVLSEWFRVLRPGGLLILETPDLYKSFKKLKKENSEKQKVTLQWIYGIDSCGMQHKVVLPFELLRALLEEIGFEDVLQEDQRTHKYERGLRVVCRKPLSCRASEIFALFRKCLRSELEVDDSDVLIGVENYCIKEIYGEFLDDKEDSVNRIIARSAVCNPKIALAFCRVLFESGEIGEEEYGQKTEMIDYLIESEFHRKLFTLWSRYKKSILKTDSDYEMFIENVESRVVGMLNARDYGGLEYILSLDAADIDVFNMHVVQLAARRLFNRGVKEFCRRKHEDSRSLFLESVKLNPENPLCYWNIARLGIVLGYGKESVLEGYADALLTVRDKRVKVMIEKERELFCVGKAYEILKEAVSEDALNV